MYLQYLKIKPSKTGMGVFTTIQIPANLPIMEVRGPVYVEKNIPDAYYSKYLQVGPNTFLGPSGGIEDNINHSCNPNCMVHVVGNRVVLYSLYVILPNTELTFDYSTTSTDTPDKWQMNCQCGDFNCRKIISGFQNLDPALQQKMMDKGIVPLYISNPNMIQRK